MLIGYARVSTQEQSLYAQEDLLKKAGCERIFSDKISGAYFFRQGLYEMKSLLREGDIILVWRLDRLGRSMKELILLVNELEKRKVGLRSMTENIDTTTPTGKLVFHIFASLAEFEKNLISERTKVALQAAKERGNIGGRPRINKENLAMAVAAYHNNTKTVTEICNFFKIGRMTLYREIKKNSTKTHTISKNKNGISFGTLQPA